MSDCTSVDPCRCPLCGQANRCALAAAPGEGERSPCWCTLEHFTPALLAQVPAAARDRACICAACVRRGGPPPSPAGAA